MTDVLKTLGIEPVPPLVGFVWREEIEAAKKEALTSFLAAVKEGNQILATNDAAWRSAYATSSSRPTTPSSPRSGPTTAAAFRTAGGRPRPSPPSA